MATSNLLILRKIRKDFDYKDYVEAQFQVKYSANGELRINCPKCVDLKFKCYINDEKKYFNCFKCDFNSGNYDVFDFVAASEGITRAAAMMKLAREYSETAPSWQHIIEQCKVLEVEEDEVSLPTNIRTLRNMPAGSKPMDDPSDPEQEPFWSYLRNRGFTDAEVAATKAHYVGKKSLKIHDREKRLRGDIGHRILFPVYGGDHKLVSWLGRSTDDRTPKYFNAPDSEASRTLWPFVPCKGQRAVVVEGLIDSLAVRRHGFSAYATLGKKISYDQIALLKSWNITSVVLFWDKKDAKREMLKAIETLKLHFNEVLVPDFATWPADKDSGDTLGWEEGSVLLNDILTNKLINVDSMEFSVWAL